MIRMQQVKLPVEAGEAAIKNKVCHLLKARESDVRRIEIRRRSLDARKKPEFYYVYTLDVELKQEKKFAKKVNHKNIMYTRAEGYEFPEMGREPLPGRPVIIGSGPAGLCCAWMLAKYGYRPILLERGDEAAVRRRRVDEFWSTGNLDPQSNVQFGEGGAGTFSDGKLNTSVKDPKGRVRQVLSLFVHAGAPQEILYDQKPHLGTDVLVDLVQNLRRQIEEMGGEVHFRSQMTDLRQRDGRMQEIQVNGGEWMPAPVLVLAIGHSARDTVELLYSRGLSMESKAFAVGVRVEHPQEMINLDQYGRRDPGILGAAPYKVTHQLANGRGVYSFCMCPGGWVVNASSEPGHLAVNGMSYQARDGRNANSALIVTVNPRDYTEFCGSDARIPEPLRGIAFQRNLERAAYNLAQGAVPMQLFGDFCGNKPSRALGEVLPCIKGSAALANLREILPDFLSSSLAEGIKAFGRKLPGFDRPDCVLSAVESRTSSPVRIPRDEELVSSIKNLYPCGEGAGYAGGITSAAVDGLRVAEAIRKKYMNFGK